MSDYRECQQEGYRYQAYSSVKPIVPQEYIGDECQILPSWLIKPKKKPRLISKHFLAHCTIDIFRFKLIGSIKIISQSLPIRIQMHQITFS